MGVFFQADPLRRRRFYLPYNTTRRVLPIFEDPGFVGFLAASHQVSVVQVERHASSPSHFLLQGVPQIPFSWKSL
ncbi:hypothetical protein GN956_G10178 [Arapaima gigas]